MKSILITGSGVHMQQYVETLMFNSEYELFVFPEQGSKEVEAIKKYGVKTITTVDLRKVFEEIELLIVANIPENKMQVLELLRKYKYNGPLILEKPTALTKSNLYRKKHLLEINYYIVAYSRYFYQESIKKYFMDKKKIKEIRWPNFYHMGIDIFRDTLPHVLDLILIANDYNFPKIQKAYYEKGKMLHIEIAAEEYMFYVDIYETIDENNMVMVDNQEMEWPNSHYYINQMVDKLLSYDKVFVVENNRMDDKISILLFDIYERCKRKYKNIIV